MRESKDFGNNRESNRSPESKEGEKAREKYLETIRRTVEQTKPHLLLEDSYGYGPNGQWEVIGKRVQTRPDREIIIDRTFEQNWKTVVEEAQKFLEDRLKLEPLPGDFVNSSAYHQLRIAREDIVNAIARDILDLAGEVGDGNFTYGNTEKFDDNSIKGKTFGAYETFKYGRNAGGISFKVPGCNFEIDLSDKN